MTNATQTTEWTVTPGRDNSTVHVALFDFGIKDRFGRAIGCKAIIVEMPAFAGTQWMCAWDAHITTEIQSTRDGKNYGAIPPRKRHAAGALDDARTDLLKRVEQSAKRQRKEHAAE